MIYRRYFNHWEHHASQLHDIANIFLTLKGSWQITLSGQYIGDALACIGVRYCNLRYHCGWVLIQPGVLARSNLGWVFEIRDQNCDLDDRLFNILARQCRLSKKLSAIWWSTWIWRMLLHTVPCLSIHASKRLAEIGGNGRSLSEQHSFGAGSSS